MHFTYLFFAFFLSMTAYAEVPFYDFVKEQYRVGIETYYLSTDANYNSKGNSEDLASGFGYSQAGVNLKGRYTLSETLSFFGGTSFRNAKAENVIENKDTFDLPHAFLGANYHFGKLFFDVIPEFKFLYPLKQYDESEVDASTSENVISLEAGSHFYRFFSNFLFHTYGGLEYKSQDFASLLHYQFNIYYFLETIALSAGLRGFFPLGNDSNDDFLRAAYIARNNGGSFIYNADEPQRLDLNVQVGYVVSESSRLYIEGIKSLRGERSADYYQGLVGFEYRWDMGPLVDYNYDDYEEDEFKFEDEEEKQAPTAEFQAEMKSFNKPKMVPKRKIEPKKVNTNLSVVKKDMGEYDEKTGSNKVKKKPVAPKAKKYRGKKKRIRINF